MWQLIAFVGTVLSTIGLALVALNRGPNSELAGAVALACGFVFLALAWSWARRNRISR